MNGTWTRWVCFCLSLLLAAGTLQPAHARKQVEFVHDLAVWQENGDLRLQWVSDREYERLEIAVVSHGEEENVSYADAERVSLVVQGADPDEDVMVQVRGYEGAELLKHALFAVPAPDQATKGRLRVHKGKWEKPPRDADRGVGWIGQGEVLSARDIREAEGELLRTLNDKNDSEGPEAEKEKTRPSSSGMRVEIEPNNKQSQADWVYPDMDAYGKIQRKGDVDYWKVKVPADGTFTVWLSQIPDGRDYDLAVYDSSGRRLADSRQKGQMDELVREVGLKKNGWLYIAVRGAGDSYDKDSYYRLRASFQRDGGGASPDSFEPNDSFDGAAQLPPDGVLTATLHRDEDVDYYTFHVPLAATIELSLVDAPREADLELSLYDGKRRQMGDQKGTSLTWNGDPGVYYAKVAKKKGADQSGGTYKLQVRVNTIPVILVPGIGGSRLMAVERGEETEAWLNLDGMIGDPVDPPHRRYLQLAPARPGSVEVGPLNSGFTVRPDEADGGFRSIEYVSYDKRAMERAEVFHSMVKQFEKMGYEKGRTLFAFPYDWRFSNSDHAAGLKQQMDEAMKLSGAGQVQLVVHSMGGLVAKETLLRYPDYQPKTRRLVYIGTPFLGSPRAYQALKLGYNFGIEKMIWDLIPYRPMSEETGKLVARYSPAVYELLPSERYVKQRSYLNLMSDEKRPFRYDEIVSDPDIRPPYPPLTKAGEEQHEKWDTQRLNVAQYVIAGDGQPTLMGYDFNRYSKRLTPFFAAEGDGTVPLVSALHGKEWIKRIYYVAEEHAALPRNPLVIRQVAALLQGQEQVQPGMRLTPRMRAVDYLLIYRSDGALPEVDIRQGRDVVRTTEASGNPKHLSVEVHGNVVVVHLLDPKGPIRIQSIKSGEMRSAASGEVIVERITSRGGTGGKRVETGSLKGGGEAIIFE